MTGPPSVATTSCGEAVRALLDGRWDAWPGLPSDCSLASLASDFGGSSALDTTAYLGVSDLPCGRSTLNDAPILVWDAHGKVLLVECDLLSEPRRPPGVVASQVHRLDIHWGVTLLEGGEAVIPERGLALILTSTERVVACRGFEPTTIDEYIATRRPKSGVPKALGPAPRGILR